MRRQRLRVASFYSVGAIESHFICSAIILLICLGCKEADIGQDIQGKIEPIFETVPATQLAPLRQSIEYHSQLDDRQSGKLEPKQILFGDMHVHTAMSLDYAPVNLMRLSVGNTVNRNIGVACDVARFCAGLDYWALTDHAESYTPNNWQAAKASIRQCNAAAKNDIGTDMVSFVGFEWSQWSTDVDNQYGHHNVYFKEDSERALPLRPIAATSTGGFLRKTVGDFILQNFPSDLINNSGYGKVFRDIKNAPTCESGIASPLLPGNCYEEAANPALLVQKLDEWGLETMIIPHAPTAGYHAPTGSSFAPSLRSANRPDRIDALEIISSHGNSERHFDIRRVAFNGQGQAYCPEPFKDYLPPCWRAGSIAYKRCMERPQGNTEACEQQRDQTRLSYINDYELNGGDISTPYGKTPLRRPIALTENEWLDAGQIRNDFFPAYDYRPQRSAQYALAMGDFSNPDNPLYFRWGFIGSTDTHDARPASATVKEASPDLLSSSIKNTYISTYRQFAEKTGAPAYDSRRSMAMTGNGGLAAVHSAGRNREAIWDAFKRREVYATSGDRILLWFNLLDQDNKYPMGTELVLSSTPRFEVQAWGDFIQRPGCPPYAVSALGPDKITSYCHNECYYPSNERKRITRIEIVRIQRQISEEEPIAPLIDDPWKVVECPDSEQGCQVQFSDPAFPKMQRDTLYYVRAIQQPTLALNGGGLQTRFDRSGNPAQISLCSPVDGCPVAEVEERAWSSPIYIRYQER